MTVLGAEARSIGGVTILALVLLVPLTAAATALIGQPQLTVAVLLFLAVAGVRLLARTPAIYLLWGIWVVAPLIRRILALEAPAPANDPLSVLPFVCTLLLAVWDLPAVGLRTLGPVVGLAGLGLLFGVPSGIANPATLAFAGLAYGSALAAVLIGAADHAGPKTLQRALLPLGVASAVYGIAQYFLPALPWDDNWLQSVQDSELRSVGAPEPGHIRVFGSLNSPGTFAVFLAIAALPWFLHRSRGLVAAIPALSLITVALALTYVRSAWLAGAVGVALMAVSAGRRSLFIIGAIAIAGGAVFVLGETGATTDAVLARVASIGGPGADASAQERFALIARVLPDAAAAPFGQGLGQAGIATRLGGSDVLGSADNGYLAILYQVGPFGFALFLASSLAISMGALRVMFRARDRTAPLIGAALASFLVAQFFGDTFYGITGVFFWYFAGLHLAGRERERVLHLAGVARERTEGLQASGGAASPR